LHALEDLLGRNIAFPYLEDVLGGGFVAAEGVASLGGDHGVLVGLDALEADFHVATAGLPESAPL